MTTVTDPDDPVAWVALHLSPGPGPREKWALVRRHGGSEGAVRSLPGARGHLREAERELRRARRLGVRVVPRGSVEYPAGLEEIHDPPLLLYVKGRLEPGVVRVAVVGSRRASAYGRRVAEGLARALAARGIEIVSGGARGIDTCAHRGALVAGGRTLVVTGSGLSRPYPPENATLFEEIAANGAVASEFPLELGPRPGNFPRRNRILSGVAAAIVVVEAARRSGSLITARHALEQGREVLAVPGPVSSDLSEGCHRLIQEGAKLLHHSDDLVEELSPMYADALPAPQPSRGEREVAAADLGPDEAAVLGLFDGPEPLHIDRLAEEAPFHVARVHAALLSLEIRGVVEQLTGGYYLAPPRKGS